MPLRPHDRLGPYEVVSPIGSGGMGEVYKARDTRLGRTVAIKVLPAGAAADPERRRRFEQEARAASALNHPHICVLHDIGEVPAPEPVGAGFSRPAVQFLVMEYLDGQTLAARLAKGPLPLSQALEYAAQIADALAAAHKSGILHRDLKPGNVMLSKTGAKLLDFGLAKLKAPADVTALTTAAAPPEPATAQGLVLGTVPYMAPEQLEGKPIDARTDLFAFGAMLYEMVTGRRAFQGTSAASVIAAILASEPPPVSSLQPLTPPALDRLVRRCLAKSPEDRWDTAHDVTEELRWICETSGAVAPVSPVAAAHARGRRLAATVAVGLGGAALAAALVWTLRPIPRTAPPPVVRTLIDVRPADELNSGRVSTTWMPTPGGSRTALTWTPDGRALVFVGRRGGAQQLYVRRLDQEEAHPLAGTEGAQVPVVSTDGQQVAFWSNGAIRRVPIAGGPPVSMIEGLTTPPSGLAWARAGQLIYSSSAGNEPLWQVRGGGIPTALTSLQPGEWGHVLPHVLADDKAVLFTVRKASWTWGGEQVVVQVLATGERKVLLRDGTDARYLPTGHLVFLRQGVLLAVPFDVQRLEVRGEPAALVEGVAEALASYNSDDVTGAGQFSVSLTGTLAYIPGSVPSYPPNRLVAVDRRGQVTRLPAPQRSYGPIVRVSPDGRLLAVVVRSLTELGLWIYDTSRPRALRKLTPGGEVARATWTPDGARLGFGWVRDGRSQLVWQRVDGDAPEPLAPGLYQPCSWSPDGKEVALVKGSDEIWVLSLEGAEPRLRALVQTRHTERCPNFSPDGQWLAYASSDSGRFEVFVQPYPGPGPRTQVSIEGGDAPAWNPNGRELFFVSLPDSAGRRWMMAVDVQLDGAVHVGIPRPLFEFLQTDLAFWCTPVRCYDVAPDGQRFFVTQREPVAPTPPVTHISLVQNWFEELKAKVRATK